MSIKEDIYRVVDEIPEAELSTALRYLEQLRDEQTDDPVLRMLMEAPLDDEPETPEEAEAVAEAWQEYQRGETSSWEEVKKRLAE